MQTVVLRVSDDFMPKLNALLDILPKNKVKIKNSQKDELIKKITDEFKESLAEAEAGNTIKTGRAVVLNAKI
ncbi:MAG TPA: hypothetical protein PLV58_07775 [Campylobacterales bacterium]|nr:hypothetical protein [Campylobacterales bacterium]